MASAVELVSNPKNGLAAMKGTEMTKTGVRTISLGVACCFGLAMLTAPYSVNAQSKSGSQKQKSTKKKTQTDPPGGANQVEGLNGKIGQMLFTGRWRFQVHDVQTVDTYTLKFPTAENDYAAYHDVADYDSDSHTFKTRKSLSIVAVKALVKNGQTSPQQLGCYLGHPRTAVTDNSGNSYPPIAYDMLTRGAWVTKSLLPGSGEEMTVLFSVPEGTVLKDLVFTLNNWSDGKGKDVRVSLAKQ